VKGRWDLARPEGFGMRSGRIVGYRVNMLVTFVLDD